MTYAQKFIQSVSEVDASLQRALMDMARDSEKIVLRGVGDRVSEAQRLRILDQLGDLIHLLWGDLVPAEIARMMAMAEQRARDESDEVDRLLARRTRRPAIVRAVRQSQVQRARRVIDVFKTREESAKFELSPRVWKWEAWSNGQVQRKLSESFARGLSSRDIAREVRRFVDPTTPGGASYAAKRLGRTEVANAFHQQTIKDYLGNPFVTGLKWNLSRSHPRLDPCDTLARNHSARRPAGVYVVAEVPAKPHPQCMCHVSPVVPSEEEFRDRYLEGEMNGYLLNKFPDIDPQDLPPY